MRVLATRATCGAAFSFSQTPRIIFILIYGPMLVIQLHSSNRHENPYKYERILHVYENIGKCQNLHTENDVQRTDFSNWRD